MKVHGLLGSRTGMGISRARQATAREATGFKARSSGGSMILVNASPHIFHSQMSPRDSHQLKNSRKMLPADNRHTKMIQMYIRLHIHNL